MKSNKSVKAMICLSLPNQTEYFFYKFCRGKYKKKYKLRDNSGRGASFDLVSIDSNGNIQAVSKG